MSLSDFLIKSLLLTNIGDLVSFGYYALFRSSIDNTRNKVGYKSALMPYLYIILKKVFSR